jgi:hypothetical protein
MKWKEHVGLKVLTAAATNSIISVMRYRPFWEFTDVSDERSSSTFREK